MVKSIFLQDGEEIFVDDEDYERVSQHTWCKSYAGNSRTIAAFLEGKNTSLQTFIKKGSFQQIKNNDFTRKNLTTKGNRRRWSKAKSNNSSKYKGVIWDKTKGKWRANINLDGTCKFLGRYLSEDEAAKAYNQAVLEYWDGEGYMNVIGEDNRSLVRSYKSLEVQKRKKVGKSNFRGVTMRNKYISSQMRYKGRQLHLGTFPTKNHAALTYNKCAIYLYGDNAILNDVPMTDELKAFIENWEIPKKILDLKNNTYS